jgi:hypothetical protein
MIELKCQTMFVNAELTLGIKKMLLFGAKNKFQTPKFHKKNSVPQSTYQDENYSLAFCYFFFSECYYHVHWSLDTLGIKKMLLFGAKNKCQTPNFI